LSDKRLDCFTGCGEVIACNGHYYTDPVDDGFRVEREPAESVDAFMKRAADIARTYYQTLGSNCLVL
jgi:hypothetical protein